MITHVVFPWRLEEIREVRKGRAWRAFITNGDRVLNCHRRAYPWMVRNGASYPFGVHYSVEAAEACAKRRARKENKVPAR